MRKLWLAGVCLLGLGPALAEDAKKPDAPPAKNKCTLGYCGCDLCEKRERFENERLWRLASEACWMNLAQYHVMENTEKANGQTLDRAYAEARRTGKIVLYVGNTGG